MNNKTKFYHCATLLILLSACISSKYSHKKKGEKVAIKVVEDAKYLQLNKLRYQNIPNFNSSDTGQRGLAIGQLASLAILGINKLIEIDKSQFTASYGQSASELYFYNRLSEDGHFDPSGIQFKGIEVSRKIKVKKKDTIAFYAAFELDNSNPYEILNGSVFHLRVKELKLNYSKAKASDTRWFAPWSWGDKNLNDKMNMDIELRFYTSYVTEAGIIYNNLQIGKFNLNLRDMPLNPKADNAKSYYDSLAGDRLNGYSFIVPRSCGFATERQGEEKALRRIFSQGNYRIEVDIKETGKEKYIKTILGENAGQIIKEGSNQAIKFLNKK